MTPAAQATGAAMPAVFRKDAQYWTVAFDGSESRLKHSRGLAYLAELLRHPDRELHTLDLATRHRVTPATRRHASARDDAGAMLDPAAKAAYRERLAQMRAEVEEATALNDLRRAERAREEIEVLMQQLAGAVGLGNRARKIHSNAERARVAVATKAVTLALRTIAEANPSLRATWPDDQDRSISARTRRTRGSPSRGGSNEGLLFTVPRVLQSGWCRPLHGC